jgi:glycine oxidase
VYEAPVRVIVIGAGVMGSATALALSRRGVRDVVVLERAVPGAEASSAAAGMLAAQMESKSAEERARYVRAREEYAGWAAELRELTGVDVGFRRSGLLALADAPSSIEELALSVQAQQAVGLRAEIVDGAGARAIEPELAADTAGGAWFPDEAQIDPPQLLRALVAAVARSSVVVRSGVTVSSLVEERGACAGVELDGREVLRGDAVVLAAGSWSSLVRGVPAAVRPVRPVRGQLVQLEERPPRLTRIMFSRGGYVVPRGDGRVICGSTMEDVGHRREVTADGVRGILAAAIRIAPALGVAEMSRAWCNFRPFAEGGAQIGRGPMPGLFLATGHHRNGILLAKTTADEVAAAVLGSPQP